MRATAEEEIATQALRENCNRRRLAFKVAERTDGTWRGCVFSLDAEPHVSVVSRSTRILLIEALTRIVTTKWPLRRGRKSNAAPTKEHHGQQVEAAQQAGEVVAGSRDGEGAAGAHVDLVARDGVASRRADGERGGHQRHRNGTRTPAASASRTGRASSGRLISTTAGVAQ